MFADNNKNLCSIKEISKSCNWKLEEGSSIQGWSIIKNCMRKVTSNAGLEDDLFSIEVRKNTPK